MFPGAPADVDTQAHLGDQGGPVTPPPGSSSLSQPALGSAQTPTGIMLVQSQTERYINARIA